MPVIPENPPAPNVLDGFGPCEAWEPIWCVELPTASAAISGHAVQMATEILWARTGMIFDQCTLTIRPCRQDCWGNDGWPGGWWQLGAPYPMPALINGSWYNITCGSCSGDCSCTTVSEILLPGPVTSINKVKVDGDTLSKSAYRLDDWRKLVRLDGQMWPTCNNLNLSAQNVGTWSVNLTYGIPVPTMGRMAVGELAYQLILACLGDDCCKLPYQVQQITRQGVSIKYPDISEMFGMSRDGRVSNRLGLQYCDMFIDAANPYGLRQRSEVYKIDQASARITNTGL